MIGHRYTDSATHPEFSELKGEKKKKRTSLRYPNYIQHTSIPRTPCSFVPFPYFRFFFLFYFLSFYFFFFFFCAKHCITTSMSGVSRAANLFYRTSRSSLLRPRAVNPVHHVFSNDRLAARGMATVFERTKPHVNIGMVM